MRYVGLSSPMDRKRLNTKVTRKTSNLKVKVIFLMLLSDNIQHNNITRYYDYIARYYDIWYNLFN